MKKITLSALMLLFVVSIFAQENPPVKKKKSNFDLSGRANDHFMIQLGSYGWPGIPDSIKTKGFSKSINAYFLFDFPFKTNPRFSVAVGAGFGGDMIYFDKTYVGIKDNSSTIPFTNQSDTSHFKKNKLSMTWIEAPVELRYTFDPEHNGKSLKLALGVKVGALLNAHTRNKDFVNKSGGMIYQYTQKESSKKFFNGNRVSITARAGMGHFSLFYTYQVSSLFKENRGPDVNPFSFGLNISGL
ncbi:MAG: outer membrane beta-barrel protein [Bacteroidetes bacterium]|nr:outer membrane beta-barrel protein [Bacteroidota bacterium]MBS1633664.1 outer membrane beta-barrel protein [Bacteroidota bacterium]